MENEVESSRRLAALQLSGLLDSLPETAFDRVTRLASRSLEAPVALFSLVDTQRQFFKSACGLPQPWADRRETPLSHSFCQYVVKSGETFIVNDAREHPLVADNLAVRDLNVVAYLGAPVRDPSGETLGSLCVVDVNPRLWSPSDIAALGDFAAIVETELYLRQVARQSAELAEANGVLAREYHHRVKNTLAVAASIISLSAREGQSTDATVATARDRLTALGAAHDMLLFRSESVDILELVGRLLKPYAMPGVDMAINGAPLPLHRSQVTPFCLVLHELATNSSKYGSLGNGGSLAVTWAQEDGAIRLEWLETTGTEYLPKSEGFGSKLVQTAARQLNGDVSISAAGGKLNVRLRFPLRPE